MIRLPNFQPTQINAPDVNAGVLAAPAMALGEVASAIAGVSQQFHEVAVNAQKQENARVVSEKLMGLDTDYQNLQLELQKDPDPASQITKTRDFFNGYKAKFETDDLPPAVQRELQVRFDSYAHDGVTRQAANSARLQEKRTGLQLSNELDMAVRNGDAARADEVIARGVSAGLYLPEQADKFRYDAKIQIQGIQTQKAIMADPYHWLETNPADKIPEDYDPASWNQMRNFAQSQLSERTTEDADTILDGIISGNVNSPEQVEHLAQHLRPSVRQQLQQSLKRRQAEDFATRAADPQYQQEVIGEIGAMLRNWKPQGEQFDEDYTKIAGLVRNLPAGSATREELERQIGAVRQGRTLEVKDRKDVAFKALDSFDDRMEKRLPKADDIKVADLVKQGFLKDKPKLMRLGYDKDQADIIIKAAKGDSANGQRQFIDLWGKRPAGSVNASEIEIATADALRNGNATIKWKDPASVTAESSAQADFYRASGERRTKLAEFLKTNPDATQDQIDAKVRDIADSQAVKDVRTSMLPPQPGRRRFTVDVKLSNYGYASDSTPDSYSARGIGHTNNKLTDGVSAAISKSFAARYGLKDGDELEIETTQGKFRVKYDDTVPATDSRTGDLPETIDIYRKDGSNSWGGRVLAFTKL